ncbi:MAG: hypothetical protein CMN84_03000 [Spongiibacteraceae bacterium]|nr:hypothetical protein [Spongiibacteraceae bacterium]
MTDAKAGRSILQCPKCGFKVTERLPAGRGPAQCRCVACGETLKAQHCCVFCEFGSEPCRVNRSQ